MAKRQNRQSTGAQIRGDIQSGRTGDKRPGFDPALAPLETDSEAGGVGLGVAGAAQPPNVEKGPAQTGSELSFNSAMRRFDDDSGWASRPWLWPLVIGAVVLAVGIAATLVIGIS